nr:protein POLYCHOME-like [Ipomoea batatas]
MPKAKEGLSRPVDVAEVYRRRDIDGGGIVHLVRDDVIGRENIGRRPVRAGGSALHPRRPLQDITNMIDYSRIYLAYETRRERLREGEPGTPLLRDQTALNPTVLQKLQRTPSAKKVEKEKAEKEKAEKEKAEKEKKVKTLMSMR